jgi:hypothetical protein
MTNQHCPNRRTSQLLVTNLVCSITLVGLVVCSMAPALGQQTTGVPGSPESRTTIDGRYLPNPPQPFRGQIDTNAVDSKPYWPARVVPPKGAPNVLLIMTDDVG